MAYELGSEDMEALLLGGCFFGSGGGGTVVSVRHLAAQFRKGDYYPTDKVRVVAVEEATAGDAVMVSYMGAPQAVSQLLHPEGPVHAVQQIQERLAAQGRRLAYVVPPESGAMGFVVACLVAARLGLEVIDADGAGRAVPSLPMLTFAAKQVDPRPAFLVSEGGLCVELNVTPLKGGAGTSNHQQDVACIIEHMMRPIVSESEFGQFGGLAMWVMTAKELADALPIRATLSRALTVGRALQAGQFQDAEALIEYLRERFDQQASVIFGPASLTSVASQTAGGFDAGLATLQTATAQCRVLYQNESLLAWDSGKPQPLAMAPDSLAYFVEGPGQQVFSNGDLVQEDGSLNPELKGRRITLIGLAADPVLREPDGLILESYMDLLARLGYLGPNVPLVALDVEGQVLASTLA